ncbi:coiled-coil domain-containing protein 27 isoform X1 [Fukomys damarensis]|uniref:coiled-coil domain-containing protein 27 isoform X1 n=1 Tax=Fukomys damarensis TaxID=885580 RepID=UPI001455CE60|nr:coiled-coil domain-containing protein 27 isoform X1 [Fukomys damarensis]
MFPKTSMLSERHSVSPHPIAQGLRTLRSMAGREARGLEQRLHQAPHGLGKSALATSCSRKMKPPKAVPSLSGFASEMAALRKAFLMRPSCPQFSTKATSVSHLGSGSSIHLPRVLGSCSKGQRGTEDWLLERRASDRSSDGRPLLGSKSACELGMWRRSSLQIPSPAHSWWVPGQKLPWYISIIQEKDRSLLSLGEEVQRFSKLETQVQKKDREIQMLQREMEALQKQLKCIIRSKGLETPPLLSWRESTWEKVGPLLGRLSLLRTTHTDQEDELQPEQMQGDDTLAELGRALSLELGGDEEDQGPGTEPKTARDAGARDSAGRSGSVQEEGAEEEEEEEEDEKLEEEEDEEELPQEGDSSWGRVFSMTESFEDKLLAQLEEYERTLLGFQGELEALRLKYCLATGTIVSLQRQLTCQESQMQKVSSQNEALHKELRERKQQLQAMSSKVLAQHTPGPHSPEALVYLVMGTWPQGSHAADRLNLNPCQAYGRALLLRLCCPLFLSPDHSALATSPQPWACASSRFSRLREDKKHQEVMGLIEMDNLGLRQHTSGLERELAKRDVTIAELTAKVSQLQAQVSLEQEHKQRWRQLQEDVQGRHESMQQAELQAQVALESTQARLERLRDKIMQAAFSVTGVRALSVEISDSDILEALQVHPSLAVSQPRGLRAHDLQLGAIGRPGLDLGPCSPMHHDLRGGRDSELVRLGCSYPREGDH